MLSYGYRYWLMYLVSLLLGVTVSLVFQNVNPLLFFGISSIVMGITAFAVFLSFHDLIKDWKKNTDEMKKAYLACALVLVIVILRGLLRLDSLGVIHLSQSEDMFFAGINFATIFLFFYVMYDIVQYLKITRKQKPKSRRKRRR